MLYIITVAAVNRTTFIRTFFIYKECGIIWFFCHCFPPADFFPQKGLIYKIGILSFILLFAVARMRCLCSGVVVSLLGKCFRAEYGGIVNIIYLRLYISQSHADIISGESHEEQNNKES